MKNAREEGRRWLTQAMDSLTPCRNLVAQGTWFLACFMAEQTAQTALKAYLYGKGRRYLTIHSVAELAKQCASLDPDFGRFVDAGHMLDRYYLSTRYPDTLPFPAVPSQSFTEAEARDALAVAEQVFALVRDKLAQEA